MICVLMLSIMIQIISCHSSIKNGLPMKMIQACVDDCKQSAKSISGYDLGVCITGCNPATLNDCKECCKMCDEEMQPVWNWCKMYRCGNNLIEIRSFDSRTCSPGYVFQ